MNANNALCDWTFHTKSWRESTGFDRLDNILSEMYKLYVLYGLYKLKGAVTL